MDVGWQAWKQNVLEGDAEGILALLAAPGMSRADVNRGIDCLDPLSGDGDDELAICCRPALAYAVRHDNWDMFSVLIESPLVDINGSSPDDGVTALMVSVDNRVQGESARYANKLIAQPGINVNSVNAEEESAL